MLFIPSLYKTNKIRKTLTRKTAAKGYEYAYFRLCRAFFLRKAGANASASAMHIKKQQTPMTAEMRSKKGRCTAVPLYIFLNNAPKPDVYKELQNICGRAAPRNPQKTGGRCAPVLGFFDRGANAGALLPPRRRAPALPGTPRVQSFLLYKPYEKDIFALLAVRVELSNSQKVGSDSEPS